MSRHRRRIAFAALVLAAGAVTAGYLSVDDRAPASGDDDPRPSEHGPAVLADPAGAGRAALPGEGESLDAPVAGLEPYPGSTRLYGRRRPGEAIAYRGLPARAELRKVLRHYARAARGRGFAPVPARGDAARLFRKGRRFVVIRVLAAESPPRLLIWLREPAPDRSSDAAGERGYP